ncbi:hypothetical protein [Streptomyces sp. NPDC097981]|uniref:DUF7144 family membrane protein n=1 Tax=Streptomyces sp. NPDC097981 TaxID=3155428 RepID=UPI00331A15B9
MTSTHPDTAPGEARKQRWAAGLTSFAAAMLTVVGLLAFFRGIMAVAGDDVFLTTRSYMFRFDLTGWGWIHLVLGAIAVLVSIGLFRADRWARVCGIVVAGLVIIADFLSLPYHPLWSLVAIALSAAVLWALCVLNPEYTPPP